MRYSDLQNVLEISPAGLTKLLNKLLSLDLIKREVEQDRSTYYYLTEKGEKTLNELEQKELENGYRKIESTLKSKLPQLSEEEKKRVNKILEDLKEILEL